MDAKIEAALEESIDSWEHKLTLAENGDYINILLGRNHCALCREVDQFMGSCVGCPVEESTGRQDCRCTPYTTVVMARNKLKRDGRSDANDAALIAAVKEELAFLKEVRDG